MLFSGQVRIRFEKRGGHGFSRVTTQNVNNDDNFCHFTWTMSFITGRKGGMVRLWPGKLKSYLINSLSLATSQLALHLLGKAMDMQQHLRKS
jgi:hypothetical protein